MAIKTIIKKRKEKDEKLTPKDVKDAAGIAFFEQLPKYPRFLKDLKRRIFNRRPKTTPNPTGKIVKIRISVIPF